MARAVGQCHQVGTRVGQMGSELWEPGRCSFIPEFRFPNLRNGDVST